MNKIAFFTGIKLGKLQDEINNWAIKNNYFIVNATAERNEIDGILVTVIYNN